VKTLSVETRWDGDEVTVAIAGELDLSTATQVEQALAEAEEKAPERMVLDLSGLSFMDSTGLRMVLATDGRARKQNRRFEVVPGPPQVHRVFRIALLDRRITFLEPRAEDASGDGAAAGESTSGETPSDSSDDGSAGTSEGGPA
jgi:anti-anti-sigma factor